MKIKFGLAGYDKRDMNVITLELYKAAKAASEKGTLANEIEIVNYSYPIGSSGADLCSKIIQDNLTYLIFDPILASTKYSSNQELVHAIDNYERFINNIGRLDVQKTAISYITKKNLLEPLKERDIPIISLFDKKNLPAEINKLYDQILTAQKPEAS